MQSPARGRPVSDSKAACCGRPPALPETEPSRSLIDSNALLGWIAMTTRSDEYRINAKECTERARLSPDPEMKCQYEQAERQWLRSRQARRKNGRQIVIRGPAERLWLTARWSRPRGDPSSRFHRIESAGDLTRISSPVGRRRGVLRKTANPSPVSPALNPRHPSYFSKSTGSVRAD
jgi:hypothetical protein